MESANNHKFGSSDHPWAVARLGVAGRWDTVARFHSNAAAETYRQQVSLLTGLLHTVTFDLDSASDWRLSGEHV